MKLFTKAIDEQLFKQYPLGSDLSTQMVVAKIFNPYGRGTWYLLNSDPQDPDYIWAIVDLFDVEMGSLSRSELEGLKVPPFRLGLERDTFFTPINALTLYQGLMQGKMYEDGGETKEDFLEDVKEMHESIAEITLKDGSKVSGEELMMYGHPKVIRTQFEDEEFEFADGGKIKNQYEGRTPESIWNNLSKEQRQHFLYDHKVEIEDYRGEEFGTLSSKEIVKAYNSEYKDLDKNIRNRFDNHIREGQYANGGSLEDMQRQMEKTNLLIRAKIVNLIGLDETLNYLGKDFVISPFRLLFVAVNRGLITVDDITVDLWDEAVSKAEEIDDRYRDSGEGIGSSDMGYFVRSMLNNAGIEVKMADGGETEMQQYKSYDEFVKKNIGKDEIVITVGSGGVSQPLDGATKESIDSQFKNLIFHNYLDSEFYFNYASNDVKLEYQSLVNDYYKMLINNPKDFSDFWQKNMEKSGRYNSLYQIKNTNYIDNKLVESRYQNGKKKYVIEKSRDNYVDVDKPKEYTDLLLVTYKDKASKKLKDEYKKYKKEYAGEDIVEFADGGEMMRDGGNIKSNLSSLSLRAKELAKKYGKKGVEKSKEIVKENKRKTAVNVINQTENKTSGKVNKEALDKARKLVIKNYADGGEMMNDIENRIKYVNEYYNEEVIESKKRGNFSGYERDRIIKNYNNDLKSAKKGKEFDNFLFEAGYQSKVYGKKLADGGEMMARGGRTETQQNNFGKTYKLGDKFTLGYQTSSRPSITVSIIEIMPSGLFFKVDKSEKLFSVKNLQSKGSTVTRGEYLVPIKTSEMADGGEMMENGGEIVFYQDFRPKERKFKIGELVFFEADRIKNVEAKVLAKVDEKRVKIEILESYTPSKNVRISGDEKADISLMTKVGLGKESLAFEKGKEVKIGTIKVVNQEKINPLKGYTPLNYIPKSKEFSDVMKMADGGETEVPYLTSLKSKLEHAKKYNTKKVPYYEEKIKEWTSKKENKPKMAMGGETTFEEKVKAVKSSLLKRKKVSPKVQKDYGKTYSPKEAEESAKRIVGSRVAKWNEKIGKK